MAELDQGDGLHVYRYGPVDGPVVLALHGVGGHGRRWEALATEQLGEVRVLAPDLRGHGRSTYDPPWNFETLVDDLVRLLAPAGPAVVLGHSFGGAIAVHLARSHPRLVRALVLLDPAIGLPPHELRRIAEDTLDSPDYTDAAEARAEKLGGDWGELDRRHLDAEIAEHLIPTRNGRVGWRLGVPALTAYWGELAREFVLPPPGLPTVLVQAMKAQPPFVTPAFRSALAEQLGDTLTVHEFDCDHMVALARPAEVAALVLAAL